MANNARVFMDDTARAWSAAGLGMNELGVAMLSRGMAIVQVTRGTEALQDMLRLCANAAPEIEAGQRAKNGEGRH